MGQALLSYPFSRPRPSPLFPSSSFLSRLSGGGSPLCGRERKESLFLSRPPNCLGDIDLERAAASVVWYLLRSQIVGNSSVKILLFLRANNVSFFLLFLESAGFFSECAIWHMVS